MYSYEYIRQKTVVFKNKEDILNYMKKNLKTHTNNGNGTDGIE